MVHPSSIAMITLRPGDTGFRYKDWEYLGVNHETITKAGDKVCYELNLPDVVSGGTIVSERGFVLSDCGGHSMGWISEYLNVMFAGKSMMIGFWRPVQNKKPREYIPSEWAKPLPLP